MDWTSDETHQHAAKTTYIQHRDWPPSWWCDAVLVHVTQDVTLEMCKAKMVAGAITRQFSVGFLQGRIQGGDRSPLKSTNVTYSPWFFTIRETTYQNRFQISLSSWFQISLSFETSHWWRWKVILSSIDLSQQFCEAHFISLTVAKPLLDLTSKYYWNHPAP